MAWVMSILGLILVAGGSWWVYGILSGYDRDGGQVQTLAAMMASLPGFSTIGTGLVFMAIGAGLFRLAQIHDEAKHIADKLDVLADRSAGDR